MFVVILSKRDIEEYENGRLVAEFERRGCNVLIRHPDSYYISLSDNSFMGPNFMRPDLVLSRTGSGTSYHCFNVMRQFEAMGVRVINTPASIEVASDKILTMQLAANAGIPIPKTLIHRNPDANIIADLIGFPAIVKIPISSYGNGTGLVKTATEYSALHGFIRALDRTQPILVQEYIGDRVGTDVRVHVIGFKAVAAMMRSSKSGDFRANISAGGVGEKFELTSEVIRISETIARQCNLEITGVDLLFKGNDDFVLCESNAAGGFEGADLYLNINIAALIVDYCLSLM